eukprot:jgi/Botrbrau1/21745/Bobra.43_1s0139.1
MVSTYALASSILDLARSAIATRRQRARAGFGSLFGSRASPSMLEDEEMEEAEEEEGLTEDMPVDGVDASEPVLTWRSFDDEPRNVTSLVMAPRGSLAVAADDLGRVLLFDIASIQVLRLWKAYRGAQTSWLVQSGGLSPANVMSGMLSTLSEEGIILDKGVPPSTEPSSPEASRRGRKRKSPVPGDPPGSPKVAGAPGTARLLLLLYAPRRGVLEAWQVRNGGRVASLKVSKSCCLLTISPILGQGTAMGHGARGPTPDPDCVFVLDCETGMLWSVRDALDRGFG